jgi:hypothetical protein
VSRAGIGIVAAVCLLVAPACNSTHDGATVQQPTTHSASAPKQPTERGTFRRPVPSPDGKRVVVVRHFGRWGYLEVGLASGGPRHTIFSSRYVCCGEVEWASPHVIAFDVDYIVKTIDVRSHRVRPVAAAPNFNVSDDRRWIAWWTLPGELTEGPGPAGVVSVAGDECLLVPTPTNAADLYLDFDSPNTRRLIVLREFADGSTRTISVPMSKLRRAPKCSCFSNAPTACPF